MIFATEQERAELQPDRYPRNQDVLDSLLWWQAVLDAREDGMHEVERFPDQLFEIGPTTCCWVDDYSRSHP